MATVTPPTRVRPLLMLVVLLPATVALTPRLTLFSVPKLEFKLVPLSELIVPPFSARVALLSVAAPPPTKSVFALSTRFSLPVPVALMPALIVMLLCADRVSDTSVALLVLMALRRVISPSCAPPAEVVMMTLMPLFKAVCMVLTVMMDESAPVLMVVVGGPLTIPRVGESGPVVWMVTLLGSSSHSPALPLRPSA